VFANVIDKFFPTELLKSKNKIFRALKETTVNIPRTTLQLHTKINNCYFFLNANNSFNCATLPLTSSIRNRPYSHGWERITERSHNSLNSQL